MTVFVIPGGCRARRPSIAGGTDLAPVGRAVARSSRRRADPSARLPPPPHPRPGRLRARGRGPGPRLRLRAHRVGGLLGSHHPAPGPGVGRGGADATAARPAARAVRPPDRARPGGRSGRRLPHEGAVRRAEGRPLPRRSRQARPQALRPHRRGGHPAARRCGGRQPARTTPRRWRRRWPGWRRSARCRRGSPRTWAAATTTPGRAACAAPSPSPRSSPGRGCRRRCGPCNAGWPSAPIPGCTRTASCAGAPDGAGSSSTATRS
jgi:hypothetical protein